MEDLKRFLKQGIKREWQAPKAFRFFIGGMSPDQFLNYSGPLSL